MDRGGEWTEVVSRQCHCSKLPLSSNLSIFGVFFWGGEVLDFRFFRRSSTQILFRPLGHLLCRESPNVRFSFLVVAGFQPMSLW